MCQNWHQCIFGVFSFHAGAYFTKYYLELNNFSKAYHDMTLNLDVIILGNENIFLGREIGLECQNHNV